LLVFSGERVTARLEGPSGMTVRIGGRPANLNDPATDIGANGVVLSDDNTTVVTEATYDSASIQTLYIETAFLGAPDEGGAYTLTVDVDTAPPSTDGGVVDGGASDGGSAQDAGTDGGG